MNQRTSATESPHFLHLPPPRLYGTQMVQCHMCEDWFHTKCVRVYTKGLSAEGKSDVVLSVMQADT